MIINWSEFVSSIEVMWRSGSVLMFAGSKPHLSLMCMVDCGQTPRSGIPKIDDPTQQGLCHEDDDGDDSMTYTYRTDVLPGYIYYTTLAASMSDCRFKLGNFYHRSARVRPRQCPSSVAPQQTPPVETRIRHDAAGSVWVYAPCTARRSPRRVGTWTMRGFDVVWKWINRSSIPLVCIKRIDVMRVSRWWHPSNWYTRYMTYNVGRPH